MAFRPVEEGAKGPTLYLPGRYAQDCADQDRPQYFVSDDPTAETLVIVNAESNFWRIPLDELKGMAEEANEDFRKSEKYLSRADRMKAVNQRWLDYAVAKQDARVARTRFAITGRS